MAGSGNPLSFRIWLQVYENYKDLSLFDTQKYPDLPQPIPEECAQKISLEVAFL